MNHEYILIFIKKKRKNYIKLNIQVCRFRNFMAITSFILIDIMKSLFQDSVRTETYRAAIMQHQSSIAGKVIFLFWL